MTFPTIPEPASPRWRPLRAGIHNLWQYDDHRFVFHRGRLMLRGRNESGKSKALELLLPFLLDADLSPQRLDPFGSSSRQMRWNLINDDNPGVNTAIGYVWMEFGRQGEEGPQFCTLGAGLRARRAGTGVEPWYFVTDLRVDRDLHLLDASRVPLSRSRLETTLGDRGRLTRTKAEYRAEVNRRLFGMPTEQYDALIEALLQLRRPQLSKQLQPEELSRILSVSLPPLDGEVIGRLAEGFDRLERHRRQRDEAASAHDALSRFLRTYRGYVQAVARDRAGTVVAAETEVGGARAALREAEVAATGAVQARDALEGRRTALETRRADLDTRIASLKESDAWRGVQELHLLERQASEHAAHVVQAATQLEEARGEVARWEQRLAEAETEVRQADAALDAARARAREAAVRADLGAEHDGLEGALPSGDVSVLRGQVASVGRARERAVEELRGLGQAVVRAETAHTRARDRLHLAEEQLAEAAQRHEEAVAALHRAEAAFHEEAEGWAEAASTLELTPEVREALAEAATDDKQAIATAAARPQREAIDADIAGAEVDLHQVRQQEARVRAERAALAEATHEPPPPPAWRRDRSGRPGSPLYLLCEFRDGVADAVQARVEAALQSAGLLDAWVTPAGEVLDADTADAVLLAGAPVQGETLGDLLRPTPTGGVPAAVVSRVLGSIGLGQGASSAWVDTDGRWRLGPLHGQWAKPRVEYVGETAREASRQRRLAELAAELEALASGRLEVEQRLADLRERRRALDSELAAFPRPDAVLLARAGVQAAARVQTEAGTRVDELRRALERARAQLDAARSQLSLRADRLGLLAWLDDLDGLAEATRAWVSLAAEMVREEVARRGARSRADQARKDLDRARGHASAALDRHAGAERRARASQVRLDTLRDALGTDPEAILRRVREAEGERDGLAGEIVQVDKEARAAERLVGQTEEAVAGARGELERREGHRAEAADHYRLLAGTGVLAVLGVAEAVLDAWTHVLEHARAVMKEVGQADGSREARERAENRVVERHRELQAGLGTLVQVRPRRADAVLVYEGTFSGRESGLAGLVEALEADVAARDRLLSEREQELFERFLSGETHAHLRERLREAHALVDEMNRELVDRPTAGGTRLRLGWSITDEAPAGTAEAIALLLRSNVLLSERDREALGRFLRQRLEEARSTEGLGSLRDKLLAVLDYRTWYRFAIQYQERGQTGWRKLTKKAHGAGSGGQKAVMLHLPLFAAASAFYRSAARTSPRLVVLDEAFAGIDRRMRGQLMGMLAAFDLDFVMTSHEEWGFYEELDGLATYHLAREPDLRGVHTDRFVWDGGQVHELGAG